MTLHALVGFFVWLLGLCVGSFLNVVIYRLPLGMSLSKPARSFCPGCKAGIAWYDNLPVLGWLLLRARCRNCKAPISVQYPLVESVTGLAFVLVYYLLFVANARAGLASLFLPADLPLLLAWLILVAALVACSGMDLISYMVDTRITNWTVAAGVVLHAAWPRREFFVERAATPGAAALLAAFVVGGVLLLRVLWRESRIEAQEGAPEEPQELPPPGPADGTVSPKRGPAAAGGVLAIVILLGLSGWLLSGVIWNAAGVGNAAWAVPFSLAALFGATVLAGAHERPADEEIHAAIEEEMHQARGTALRELLWLAPAILAAVAVYLLVSVVPAVGEIWRTAVHWPAGAPAAPAAGGAFAPLGGAAFAVYGAMVAAIAGWILRIGFTLALGKEAFGAGDIYILAAAGAAGGWDIALLGLLFSVGLAMAGWLLSLLLKRTTLIPFGPWLAIGFLAALWLNRPAAHLFQGYYDDLRTAWSLRPDLIAVLSGVLLFGTAGAIFVAKLLRRLIEPREQ